MRLGGGGDDQRVAAGQQTLEGERRRARLPPDRLRAFLVGIVDSSQPSPLGRRYLERVMAAEMPGARYADAQSR